MLRKILSYISLAATFFTISCTKEIPESFNEDQLDFSRMERVTLGSIAIAKDVQTRAGGTPMAIGQNFRLYAFPKGVTDMSKLITTRTYTIKKVVGEPVLDAEQKDLFLPIGNVDIFVVGPLNFEIPQEGIDGSGNPLPPQILPVASANGVTARYGVDLVSSKTELAVKAGANQFQPTPLEHRMAKVEIVVKRSEDAAYTDLKVTGIKVENQTLEGEFKFDTNGGTITAADEGTETLTPTIIETIAQKEFCGTMIVIPRKDVQFRIGVFLTCKVPGIDASLNRRMESGIISHSLEAGKINRFVTEPSISDKLLFRTRIMPWDDVFMGDIYIPSSDKMLFSYSGMDAPRMIDGKMFIPDRSGNGNHGEIVGDIKYDTEGKFYYATSKDSYIKVPSLGHVPVYTFEVTATSKRGLQSVAAQFMGEGAERPLGVHLPWTNNDIIYDAGNTSGSRVTATNSNKDIAWMENIAHYAFTRNSSNGIAILRNGIELIAKTTAAHNGLMTDNKLLWWEGKDNSQMRLYAARMSTNVDANEIKNSYKNDMATFVGINVDKDDTKRDYIKDGLILDLRGDVAPVTKTINGVSRTVWGDQSVMGNDAIFTTGHSLTHNSTIKAYVFPNTNSTTWVSNNNWMFLRNGVLGDLNSCTIEFVVKGTGDRRGTLLYLSSSAAGTSDANRMYSVHYPIIGELFFQRGGGNESYRPAISSLPYSTITDPVQWSWTSNLSSNRAVISQNTVVVNERNFSLTTKGIQMVTIGSQNGTQSFCGELHAVRIYNRPLTKFEQQYNYQTDKIKYNLAP